jgi:acyl-CoA reductase-like NAD-dependent aldehyde dehydrogenase
MSTTGMIADESLAVPHPEELFIGGRWVDPSSQDRTEVFSPFDEMLIANLPDVGLADGDAAVSAAKAAFDSGRWSRIPMSERVAVLRRFHVVMKARMDEFNRVWAAELGIPIAVASSFEGLVDSIWNDAIGLAEITPLTEVRATATGRVKVKHEPLGPVLAVLTYNGPLVALGMAVIPALLVGNTVVMKFPPESRMVSNIIADCLNEARFPEGVVSVLAANVEVSRHLVAHHDVAAVHFTGGTEAGADVATSCAQRIVPVTLELGGKGAAIIADDANLAEVLPALLESMTTLQGQVCVASTRVLVSRHRYSELVQMLVDALDETVIGNPLDPATTFGPLPSERIRLRSEKHVAKGLEQGAVVAFGGKRPDQFTSGYFLEPTLLTDVTVDMDVAQEEIFGPVYCVMPYDSIDEAVEIANRTRYGLSGSIYTNDPALAADVADKIEVGLFSINGGWPCFTAPYGGFKQSGYGRSCGVEGLLDMTRIKSVIDYSEARA